MKPWMKRLLTAVLVLVLSMTGILTLSTEEGSDPGGLSQGGSTQSQTVSGSQPGEEDESPEKLPEHGSYTTKEDVSLYLYQYGRLPDNFITKKQAQKLGWEGGSLEPYAPGKCIGGDYFGNYEKRLPDAKGREYTECDIDTLGAKNRGAKRIVFSNDGLIFYTDDHYESFELIYGEVSP